MKNSNGITLTSLVIYIMIMILVIGVIASISSIFYKNTNNLDDETKEIIEYNNFNSYFIKEIKTPNNKVEKISEDKTYILFTTGNSFYLKENKILYNNIEIAKGIKNTSFQYYTNLNGKEDPTVITVNMEFNNFSKKMNYKIEEIY